jgi:hypothetical protein
MPATRSQADAEAGGAEPEVAELLEDAAAELSAESAARKAAEERVRALEAQLAAAQGAVGGGDPFSTPLPARFLDPRAEGQDAFSLPTWAGEVMWINCDWDMLDLVAQRLEAEPLAKATVLCPYFPGQLGCGAEPKAIQLVIKCIRGVLAVHSSDHDTAHHVKNACAAASRTCGTLPFIVAYTR